MTTAGTAAGPSVSHESDQRSSSARLISVIIPTYNRAACLAEALASVAAQTYRPIEVIVADDGSDDDTASVVEQFCKSTESADFAVRYLRQENQGAPSARNLGLANARGDYIQFFDSDDELLPHKLSSQAQVLDDHPSVGYVWSGKAELDDALAPPSEVRPAEPTLYLGFDRRHCSMQVVLGLYRATICRRVGPWNPKLGRYQDWEFNVRALSHCTAVARIDGAAYRQHYRGDQQISSTSAEKFAEQIIHACEELESCPQPLDRKLASHFLSQAYASAAILFMRTGRRASSVRAGMLSARHARSLQQIIRSFALCVLTLGPRGLAIRTVDRVSPSKSGY